jgi:hypothetical protein
MLKKPHWSYTLVATFTIFAGLFIFNQEKWETIKHDLGINEITRNLTGQIIETKSLLDQKNDEDSDSTTYAQTSETNQTKEPIDTTKTETEETNTEEENPNDDGGPVTSPPPPLPDAPQPLQCDASLYIQQTIDNTTNISRIQILKGSIEFKEFASNLPFAMNSIAFNPVDKFIYGIKDKQELVQIDNNGNSKIIGTLPLPAFPYSGAFTADGTYLVNDSNTLWHIDVSTLNVTKTLPINGKFADIARNPIDGFFYGFDNTKKQLAQVDPNTGSTKYLGTQQDIIVQAGAAMFTASGDLYLYGKDPKSTKQDSLFLVNTKDFVFSFVGKSNPVDGSDGTSCVEGKDVTDSTDDTEDPDSNGGAPTIETIKVCQPNDPKNTDFGQSCLAMYPVPSPLDETKQTAYEKFGACVKEQKQQTSCLNAWARELNLKSCSLTTDCNTSTDIEIVELPEIKHEEGCFELNDEVYCPHTYENECVNIITFDGEEQEFCQPAEQKNVVLKTCIDHTFYGNASYEQSRNKKACQFNKYGVFKRPTDHTFVGPLVPPVKTFEVRKALGVCDASLNPTTGPFMITPTNPCKFTIPDKYTSDNYDAYAQCVSKGGKKDTCTSQWLAKTNQKMCTQASDCF